MLMETQKIIDKEDISLLFIDNSSCSVCSVVFPLVDSLCDSFAIKLLSVNSNDHPEVMGKWNVFVYPTIILFTNGKEAKRFEQVFAISEISDAIKRYIEVIRM